MVDKDTAFVWETEALRSAAPRPRPAPRRVEPPETDRTEWLTLREANEITGIPVSTLRTWARRDSVPSYVEKTAVSQLRMVSLEGIYLWASKLGREVGASPERRHHRAAGADIEIDLTAQTGSKEAMADSGVPEGAMLVPLDAWNRMLNQLGNLHEAGQQLAEARERAAKAETEATFLRQRLAEMRAEQAGTRTIVPVDESTADTPVRPEHLTFTDYSMAMVKHLLSTLKRRPRR